MTLGFRVLGFTWWSFLELRLLHLLQISHLLVELLFHSHEESSSKHHSNLQITYMEYRIIVSNRISLSSTDTNVSNCLVNPLSACKIKTLLITWSKIHTRVQKMEWVMEFTSPSVPEWSLSTSFLVPSTRSINGNEFFLPFVSSET